MQFLVTTKSCNSFTALHFMQSVISGMILLGLFLNFFVIVVKIC